MPPFTIRTMSHDDIPIIARWMVEIPLWQRYRLTIRGIETQLEAALLRHDPLFTADGQAQDQDRACGMAWCLPEGGFGRSAYLRLIGVRAGLAGSGIGSALLGAVEEMALAAHKDVFLLVSDFNASAQTFYQRHGYHQIGAVPGYVLPEVTEMIYWKRLRTESGMK